MKTVDLMSVLVIGLTAASLQAAEPEFNRECALGLVMMQHIPTDCSVNWTADDGKIYCFSGADAKTEFLKDAEANRVRAEVFWTQPESH